MKEKILFVDDDHNILASFRRQLRKRFNLETVDNGPSGLELIEKGNHYAVIVADMQMPEMNGVQFLEQVQVLAPDSVRMMLTGNADQATAVQAVNNGQVYRFLTKPCDIDLLALSVENGIKHYHLLRSERELLEKTLMGSVSILTEILSLQDEYTFGKGEKIKKLLGQYLDRHPNRRPENKWVYETAAMLLPIGNVAVPEELSKKQEQGEELSPKEIELLGSAPETGYELLSRIPRLEAVAEIIRYQRKNYNGSGLPAGDVVREGIPEGARILRMLVDLVELESKDVSRSEALQRMKNRLGFYDPKLFAEFFECFDAKPEDIAAEEVKIMEVELNHIMCGDILHDGLVTNDGMLLLSAGTEITLVILKRIHSFSELYQFKVPVIVERKTVELVEA